MNHAQMMASVAAASAAPRSFAAKFQATCPRDCGGIEKGDRIAKIDGRYAHVACDGDAPAPPVWRVLT